MDIFNEIEVLVAAALKEAPSLKNNFNDGNEFVTVEVPRDKNHGDLSTNAAMVFAKKNGVAPRDLADELCKIITKDENVISAIIAGPGFINITLKDSYWVNCLKLLLETGLKYGSSSLGSGKKINVEYVSANPTGPLHAAHARGAVVGDALAKLLQKVGYDVCKEYYINDAGTQVDVLARSTFLRYREALGDESILIPEGHYPGLYLKKVGSGIADRDGDKWLLKNEVEWLPEFRKFSIELMMQAVKKDLAGLGIDMDRYTSETSLVESGGVDQAIETLEQKGLLYEGVLEPPKGKKPEDWKPRSQQLFKSTLFGDDVDRPIRKSDGSWTYFASDIAYHLNKFNRGYTEMIDVWGADHGGYVKRMESAVRAVSGGKGNLDVKICQIVRMLKDGIPVKMSKRSGDFITIEDVVNAVGKDVIRFIMLTRRNDQVLEFDFDKVVEQSRDNPVFYVQYAHARCCSVLRNVSDVFKKLDLDYETLSKKNLSLLTHESELSVIKELMNWPRIVENAAKAHEPHRIAFYLSDVAGAFHSLWNKGKEDSTLRFIVVDNKELTVARMALIKAIALIIASGLEIIGVQPVEELRS
jgi:arginyl-tRNA synthetase